MPTPIFMDVDTGIDDAWALLSVLSHPEADLLAVAGTGGNVPVHQVCANTLAILQLARRPDIPVSRGRGAPLRLAEADHRFTTAEDTHGPTGLGYTTFDKAAACLRSASLAGRLASYDAADAWVKAAKARPGELVGIVTGPLTNLALALRAEPELPRLLRRLVIMGGAFEHPGNTTPVAEWNVHFDPEAAKEVFDAWSEAVHSADSALVTLPVVCGLNLTERVLLTPKRLHQLAELVEGATSPSATETTHPVMSPEDRRGKPSTARNPLLRLLEDATRFYFEFHHDQGEGYLAQLHDPFAAEVALDPEITLTVPAAVDVELLGLITRGMTVADWSRQWGREPNALVAVSADPQAFFDRVIPRLAAFLRSVG